MSWGRGLPVLKMAAVAMETTGGALSQNGGGRLPALKGARPSGSKTRWFLSGQKKTGKARIPWKRHDGNSLLLKNPPVAMEIISGGAAPPARKMAAVAMETAGAVPSLKMAAAPLEITAAALTQNGGAMEITAAALTQDGGGAFRAAPPVSASPGLRRSGPRSGSGSGRVAVGLCRDRVAIGAMSDTWSSIQAHKKQLDSLRERLQRRRKQDPLGGGGESAGGRLLS